MRIFRSDDGAEIREEDVLKIRLRLWGSKTHEAACRIDAALAPKPKLFSKPGVEIPCKVEVDPDGATTWTPLEKLKVQPGDSFTLVAQPGDKFTMLLAPDTCRGVMYSHYSGHEPCVLPPGHHPFVAGGSGGTCLICDNLPENPLHSPGHMTAPKCWRES